MDIFVYSDESGVFDKHHNQYYTYGGLIFLDRKSRDDFSRKYYDAEKTIRLSGNYSSGFELKACNIKISEKRKLFRALNHVFLFGAVIDEAKVYDRIFLAKKSKQRYLDYVYKISLKNALISLVRSGSLRDTEAVTIHIFSDEHTTATDGKYELKEALLQEYKYGTYNLNYTSLAYPPILENLNDIDLNSCDSRKNPLIRAADIVANRLLYDASHNIKTTRDNMQITLFP